MSIGTIVAAKRKWDEKWHRGRVVDVVDIDKPAKVKCAILSLILFFKLYAIQVNILKMGSSKLIG